MTKEKKEKTLKLLLGLTEQTPFPWQERLLERFLQGKLPDALDLPTGLGKTKTIAIWLAARALNKASVPTRLVYVVDRRAVVDQATKEAEEIRKIIAETPELQQALGLEADLAISTLRGQYADNRQWQSDPSAPAIIVGTVDMIGSKLLFQGYATSRKMRPYQAGLLGIDTLFVIDESHLVPPFEHMLHQVSKLQRSYIDTQLFKPTQVLALSATGGGGKDVFRLDAKDYDHNIVKLRLSGAKRLHLREPSKVLAEELADQVWAIAYSQANAPGDPFEESALQAPPTTPPEQASAWPRVIVFCNSRKTAQAVRDLLEKRGKALGQDRAKPQLDLLVGARRAWEREQGNRLTELGFLAGSKDRDDAIALLGPAFLICTSAGEVGVDLDADHMVCDLVQWERMVQRLGRVNRRGEGDATVIVVPDGDRDSEELERLAAPLLHLPQLSQEPSIRDASIQALLALKTDPQGDQAAAAATTEEPFYPALTKAVVEDWAMTILPDHAGRPEPAPWLRGWLKDDPPQVSLVWRTQLPLRANTKEERKEIDQFFQAAFPHPSELLTLPAFQAVDWLIARTKSLHRLGKESLTAPIGFLIGSARRFDRTFTLQDWLDSSSGGRKTGLTRSLGGKTLILSDRMAGLSNGLLDPKQKVAPVCSDSECGDSEGCDWPLPFRVEKHKPGDSLSRDKGWPEHFRLSLKRNKDQETTEWLVVQRAAPATEAGRAAGPIQTLSEHQQWTQVQAARLARRLDLGERWSTVLTRAALWHDAGKAAERWQRAFGRPLDRSGQEFAKLGGPIRFSVLDGYRHELGSILRIQQSDLLKDLDTDQRDLLLHMVIAHHGRGRPLVPIDSCDFAPPSVLRVEQQAVALRYARLQVRWGPWGLAWWEGLLRASDVRASIQNNERDQETS